MQEITVEQLLYAYYIRYSKLQELTLKVLSNSSSDMVDIYVDVYDMIKPLYTTPHYTNKRYVIVSSIINLAAHLRQFYWTRFHVNSRIYLVYGDETTMNHKQFCRMFGQNELLDRLDYQTSKTKFEQQLEMVKIITAYIYAVYYVRKTTDFSMFVFDNINRNQDVPAIIITKSKYAYQIPAMCQNAYLFRPKKYQGDDISFGVCSGNVLDCAFNKLSSQKTIDKLHKLHPQLLSLLYTLTGLSSKKLVTLFNSTTAINRLLEAIDNQRIINGYNSDMDYIYNALGITTIDAVNFKYRFNAVDLVFQHRIYNNTAEARDMSWLINLQDKETVQEINNNYFADNPLDLNAL